MSDPFAEYNERREALIYEQTDKEIALALQHQYVPVSLGDTRLRSETAALVATVFLMTG